MKKVTIGNLSVGPDCPLLIISGPCVIENESHALKSAEFLKEAFDRPCFQFVYKSSYDKANRSSLNSYRGPGLNEGLRILEKIKHEFQVPVLTDVHTPEEAEAAGDVCDAIQIPAFLCRQTDLLVAAGKTKAAINIKKGQFMAPWDMTPAIEKVSSSGNENILLTDRGFSFGYNNLVSDFRAIPILKKTGYPVIFDATHSVQLPGSLGKETGGQREFVPLLARCAIAAGCHGIFAESHPCPEEAKSDRACVIGFKDLPALIFEWEKLFEACCEKSLAHI